MIRTVPFPFRTLANDEPAFAALLIVRDFRGALKTLEARPDLLLKMTQIVKSLSESQIDRHANLIRFLVALFTVYTEDRAEAKTWSSTCPACQ